MVYLERYFACILFFVGATLYKNLSLDLRRNKEHPKPGLSHCLRTAGLTIFLKDMFFFFFFCCMNFLIEKQKNQRNKHNFSIIVISLLKFGVILAFTIIYPLNISLKNENGPCRFKLITSSEIFV